MDEDRLYSPLSRIPVLRRLDRSGRRTVGGRRPARSSRASSTLVDDFYAEIDRHPDARKVITGGQAQIERLKGTLVQWLRELFSGTLRRRLRRPALAGRLAACRDRARAGLHQCRAVAAPDRAAPYSLQRGWQGDAAALKETIRALNKLLDLDLAIIEDAYQGEYAARLQRSERLATLGQVAGGVAHELRNPLNVVKTSVYYLLNARNPTPEKTGRAPAQDRAARHAGRQRHLGPVELRADAVPDIAADRRRAAGARGARDQPAGRRDRGRARAAPRSFPTSWATAISSGSPSAT